MIFSTSYRGMTPSPFHSLLKRGVSGNCYSSYLIARSDSTNDSVPQQLAYLFAKNFLSLKFCSVLFFSSISISNHTPIELIQCACAAANWMTSLNGNPRPRPSHVISCHETMTKHVLNLRIRVCVLHFCSVVCLWIWTRYGRLMYFDLFIASQ